MIDFNLFDWEEIFGVIVATEGLKRNQTRGLRTEIQEIATAKYSSNQLKYVGMKEHGVDYIDIFGNRWEDKSQQKMFNIRKCKTNSFVLKNFRGNKISELEKTFDYIILKDTNQMSVGWSDWDSVYKNIEIKDAVITSHVDYSDLKMLDFFVKPKQKQDFALALENIIENII